MARGSSSLTTGWRSPAADAGGIDTVEPHIQGDRWPGAMTAWRSAVFVVDLA